MNLIADECVDRQIVDRLRGEGHEVFYMAEMDPSIPDEIILERANQKNALLLTADKDFGE
jgi:predicted nuclease of predicted toxin-antitoxin system